MATSPDPRPHPLGVPPGFVWGASTSAYQIEGAAAEDGRGPSIWDIHARIQGRTWGGHTGDVACDHYHRYAEDVALLKRLGVGAYRFSVSWPRVLPRGRGAINPQGLDFYDRLIDAVLEAGIVPWLCLYHWDLPQRLHELGGWTSRDVVGWFADYATLVARRFGDRVRHFATFNEPNVCTLFGYAMTWCAPAAEDRAAYFRASHHLNLAHGAAVDVVRDWIRDASVGCIYNLQPVHPADPASAADQDAARRLDAHWNRVYADPHLLGHYPPLVAEDYEPHAMAGDLARICRPLDWVGMNHYGPIWTKAAPDSQMGFAWADTPGQPHPEIGWPIFPEAFVEQLEETYRRYRLPIVITENGCGRDDDKEIADADGRVNDTYRITYLKLYTAAMAEAIRRGVDVRGYFIWSLLDNFEWGAGYNNRFGIVRVDFSTGRRIPKASFDWYARAIRGEV